MLDATYSRTNYSDPTILFKEWISVAENKQPYLVALVFVVFFAGVFLLNLAFPSPQPEEQPVGEDWFAAYEQGKRTGFYSSCDATNDLIFFAYTDHTSFVDAYDHSGNFQFTLYFEDKQNGVLEIRCTEQILYVSTKAGSVFVFDRDQEVRRMTHNEAKQGGFSYFWFEEKNPNFRIDNNQAYVVDAQGNPQAVFQLAQTVKLKANFLNNGKVIMLGALFVIIYSIVKGRRRVKKKGDGLREP